MAIVNTTVPITAESCDQMIQNIVKTYPFCRTEVLTRTAFQRPLRTLVIGNGPRKVIYSAAHHANEWITSLVLLKFAEELAEAELEKKLNKPMVFFIFSLFFEFSRILNEFLIFRLNLGKPNK